MRREDIDSSADILRYVLAKFVQGRLQAGSRLVAQIDEANGEAESRPAVDGLGRDGDDLGWEAS
jgi:hypothetical protein